MIHFVALPGWGALTKKGQNSPESKNVGAFMAASSPGAGDSFQRQTPSAQAQAASTPPQLKHEHPPSETSLTNILKYLGTGADIQHMVGVQISRHFAEPGQKTDFTYGSLLEETQKMAAVLQKLGIRPGQSVAMAEMNTPEFLINYLAGLSINATMVPLNLLAMQDEKTKIQKFLYMIEKTDAKVLLVGEDSALKGLQKLPSVQKLQRYGGSLLSRVLQREVEGKPARICLERMLRRRLAKQAGSPQGVEDLALLIDQLPKKLKIVTPATRLRLKSVPPMPLEKMNFNPDKNQIADVLYTSGTSGVPKGVQISHGNLEFTANSIFHASRVFNSPHDTMLMALPLFHIFGKAVQLAALRHGTTVVMLPSLKEARDKMDKVVETIADYNITVFPSVPVFLEAFVSHLEKHPEAVSKVQTVRHIISGGAALKSETFQKLQTLIPGVTIMEGYGSSEGGINLLNLAGKQGFVGSALPGVEVKLEGEDPETGAGEMLIRSPGVAHGYLKGTATEEEQKVFQTEGNWYKTGDVARLDPQENMYQIVGRNNDVIKVAGERRPAEDFESAMQLTELVNDAMAISYKPDRETEKAVVVALAKAPTVTEENIKHVMGGLAQEKRLAGWSIPKHVVVLHRDTFPDGFIGFKRQYAAARDFVKKAVEAKVVVFKDTPDANGKLISSTQVPDPEALKAFVEGYRYTPPAKKSS